MPTSTHKESLDKRKVRVVSLLSFVFGLTDAFFAYVLSSYFERVIGSENVGIFYLVTFSSIFFLLWQLHRVIRRLGGGVRSFFFFMVVSIFLSATLSVLPVGWFAAGLVILLLIFTNLAWVTLDVVLEESSEDGATGRVRGLHLTIMNAGVLLAPFISTRVLGSYDFSGIFSGVTIGFAVLLSLAVLFLRSGAVTASAKMAARSAWRKMFQERDLLRIFHVSLSLEIFYVIMVIYTPIYLRSIGISWDDIGILFTVMLLPFVILQYPLGVLADKRFGEKEFLMLSLGLSALSVCLMGIFSSPHLFFWGVILFLSRVGAAAVEVLRDAYFYKQVDGRDDDLIAFFRTARPIANVAGALFAIPFLLVFPLQYIFFLPGVIFLSAMGSAYFLNDSESEFDRSLKTARNG